VIPGRPIPDPGGRPSLDEHDLLRHTREAWSASYGEPQDKPGGLSSLSLFHSAGSGELKFFSSVPSKASGDDEVTGTVQEAAAAVLATLNQAYPTNKYCCDEHNIEVAGEHPVSTRETGALFELHEKGKVGILLLVQEVHEEEIFFFEMQHSHRWGELKYIARPPEDGGGADDRERERRR